MKITKQRLNNNGFILLELVIILVIFSFIVSINLFIGNKLINSTMMIKEVEVLKSYLTKAKQLSMNNKMIVSISFEDRILSLNYNNHNEIINFKSLSFSKSKELYFNANGNINQAYTILFKDGLQARKLIFYIGKGWYKIE